MRGTSRFPVLLGAVGLLLAAMPAWAQAAPPPAAHTVLTAAIKEAKTAHKPILLVFGASW